MTTLRTTKSDTEVLKDGDLPNSCKRTPSSRIPVLLSKSSTKSCSKIYLRESGYGDRLGDDYSEGSMTQIVSASKNHIIQY